MSTRPLYCRRKNCGHMRGAHIERDDGTEGICIRLGCRCESFKGRSPVIVKAAIMLAAAVVGFVAALLFGGFS